MPPCPVPARPPAQPLAHPLTAQSSVEKISEIDSHCALAISGLAADARTLVEHARVEAANHRFTYDEPLRIESLTQVRARAARALAAAAAPRGPRRASLRAPPPSPARPPRSSRCAPPPPRSQSVCDLKMSFGEGGEDDDEGEGGRKKVKMSRPFGVSLLIAGCDARGPQLFNTDPSGTYVSWDAQAIGNGSEAARTILQERYAKSMSLEAAAVLIVRVLTETMEEKITSGNVELAVVTPGGGYRMYSKAELEAVIAKAQEELAAEGAR